MRLAAVACLVLICDCAAAAPVPASIKAPADAVLIGTFAAKGVQIYRCANFEGGLRWTLEAPDADLMDNGRIFAHHSAGPTWKVQNGAEVVGKVMAKAPAPEQSAVAWLLLSAKTTGAGRLAGTRFVQRLNTVGGIEPAASCSPAGAEQRVPYTADYTFYR